MKTILLPQNEQLHNHFFINDEIGILHAHPNIYGDILNKVSPPFIINDHRMGIVLNGTATVNLNLVDHDFHAGTFAFLTPGTIIHPKTFSDDFILYGIAIFNSFTMPFTADATPQILNGYLHDIILPAQQSELITARHILDTLWHLTRSDDYPQAVASSLISSLIHLFNNLYISHGSKKSDANSRYQTVFDRFIQLVNQHCHKQHHIAYYADRMCLTERYLSSIISQTTGMSAKEWIDRALVMRIKVDLIHTDKPVCRIADELHFDSPSFFSRYFKRLTGVTPGEFRAGRGNDMQTGVQ